MKTLLRYLILLPLLTGCADGKINTVKTKYYVQSYWPLEEIVGYVAQGNNIWLYENIDETFDVIHEGQPLFYELSDKHGDTSYNGKILEDNLPKSEYFAVDFSSINITCDSDFDSNHPVGASLNDLIRLISVTPYDYVKSGYKNTFDWDGYEHLNQFENYFAEILKNNSSEISHVTLGKGKVTPVYKYVADLNKNDLALLGRGHVRTRWQIDPLRTDPFAVLSFTQNPESGGKYTFNIQFITDDNKVIVVPPVEVKF